MRSMKQTLRVYLQPAFLICAAVLAVGAVAVDELNVKKVRVPLKRSLDLLDESKLGSYKVVAKEKIDNQDVVKVLGTRDYLQWVLEDSDVSADSAVRKCSVLVTYYPLPDQVPHVPEECYTGSGYQVLASKGVTFEVARGPGPGDVSEIRGRHLVFTGTDSKNWWGDAKFSVSYVFNVNGEYADSREGVRWVLNKHILSRHAYFSKVEWKFFNTQLGQTVYPDKEESLKASEKLLAALLPVLEGDHWPGWPVVDVE
jgi:hypothetical protein